jgi:hypothetical protein
LNYREKRREKKYKPRKYKPQKKGRQLHNYEREKKIEQICLFPVFNEVDFDYF